MHRDAYDQYASEIDDWLHRGRIELLRRLLADISWPTYEARLLEVGAGVGQNLVELRKYGRVDAGEIDALGQQQIGAGGLAEHLYPDPIPFTVEGSYDVVCALDVVEHLEDDVASLAWMASILREGGHLVVTVPAYQWLFGDHDRALGHYRRYTRQSLVDAFPEDFEILRVGYFNSLLFPVVALSRLLGRARARLLGAGGDPRKQRSSVPALIDAALFRILRAEAAVFSRRAIAPFGLSVVVLARRRSS